MKAFFSIATIIFGFHVGAEAAQRCSPQAEGMAQVKYLMNNPGIQGHEFVAKTSDYKIERDNSAVVEVTINGRNDEAETWTEKYEIRLDLENCTFAQSIRK
jgi:hypothetical protein